MPRYMTRPKAEVDCDWWQLAIGPIPTVSESGPTDTGLLNSDGNTIWRMPNPIGFGRDDEW